MKLTVSYPDRGAELAMLVLPSVAETPRFTSLRSEPPPLFSPHDVLALRARRAAASASPPRSRSMSSTWCGPPRDPAQHTASNGHPCSSLGESPRATIALVRVAPGHAAPAPGRDPVTPHDVKSLARDILRHRIIIKGSAEATRAEASSADDIIGGIWSGFRSPDGRGFDAPISATGADRSCRRRAGESTLRPPRARSRTGSRPGAGPR